MKILIILLLLILVEPEVTSFASGGLMCLGKVMCKSKDTGRKKKMTWTIGTAGLWRGTPDDRLIYKRPWNGTFPRKRRMGFLKARYSNHSFCCQMARWFRCTCHSKKFLIVCKFQFLSLHRQCRVKCEIWHRLRC